MRALLLAGLLSVVSNGSLADEIVGYAGKPEACFISAKYEAKDKLLHLSAFDGTDSRDCEVTAEMLREVIAQSLQNLSKHVEQPELHSIFMGRLVHYAWLSRGLSAIAYQDPDWNWKEGRPTKREVSSNALVAGLLSRMTSEKVPHYRDHPASDDVGLTQLPAMLATFGYRYKDASVEKVMSGFNGGSHLPSDIAEPELLPYDALVHLGIEKTP